MAFHSVFYGRLFELIPEVQSRFRAGGMQDQVPWRTALWRARGEESFAQGNLFTRMFNFAVITYSSDKVAFKCVSCKWHARACVYVRVYVCVCGCDRVCT